MQIAEFDQISAGYDHVYLSPHIDDAALSCGGAIARQIAAGERVLIATLCTGAPAPEGPFNSLAQELHTQWGLTPDQAVSTRLLEDRAAITRLGADSYWAGMLDAIYRFPEAYVSRATLFSAPAPNDPLLPALHAFITELRAREPNAMFYAPFGVGSHVDHLITHAAARASAGAKLRFYEDVPYAIEPGALARRQETIEGDYSAEVIRIDATLAQKIDAINAYASQMLELFGDAAQMAIKIGDYAQSVAASDGEYGERLWLRRG